MTDVAARGVPGPDRGRPVTLSLHDVIAGEHHRSGLVPRKRLGVRTRDGRESLLLVDRGEQRADELRRAAGLR